MEDVAPAESPTTKKQIVRIRRPKALIVYKIPCQRLMVEIIQVAQRTCIEGIVGAGGIETYATIFGHK